MKTAQEVIELPSDRAAALRTAIGELEDFQSRYSDLTELAPIFTAINTVKAWRRNTKVRLNPKTV